MKKIVISILLGLTVLSCKTSKHSNCDSYSQNIVIEDSSIVRSLDILSDSAKNWSTEQKEEFAEVFFIERGKFTVPKEPIVLKTFKGY
jgi:uncharacterized protein YcfL